MKLILTDLDETLLHSDKTISDYSIQILKKCQAKGILVGFSTTRGKVNIEEYIEQVQPDFVICNGGAGIYYQNELIKTNSFSVEETRELLSAVKKFCEPNTEMTLDTLENIYWNRKDDKSVKAYADNSIYHDFVDFNLPAMKFCVKTQDEQVAKQIAQTVCSCDYLPFSDIPWYKFSSGKATKENAIKFISEKFEIPTEKIIAFGDDFNDIGMLKLCGKGVAMENAIVQVKAVADFITHSNNEDGVAKFLENNLLIN